MGPNATAQEFPGARRPSPPPRVPPEDIQRWERNQSWYPDYKPWTTWERQDKVGPTALPLSFVFDWHRAYKSPSVCTARISLGNIDCNGAGFFCAGIAPRPPLLREAPRAAAALARAGGPGVGTKSCNCSDYFPPNTVYPQ